MRLLGVLAFSTLIVAVPAAAVLFGIWLSLDNFDRAYFYLVMLVVLPALLVPILIIALIVWHLDWFQGKWKW